MIRARFLTIAMTCFVGQICAQEPLTILQDDLVLGLGRADGAASIELARGPREELAGEFIDQGWTQPFVQSVEFDNFAGISHNPQGNLLGGNFGSGDGPGEIFNLSTTTFGEAGQLIGDTAGTGGSALSLTKLGGLSISPNNSKVAVSGYDSGAVIVYDYSAGDTAGGGASLSNGREALGVLPLFSTQGTAWRGNSEVLSLSTLAISLALIRQP